MRTWDSTKDGFTDGKRFVTLEEVFFCGNPFIYSHIRIAPKLAAKKLINTYKKKKEIRKFLIHKELCESVGIWMDDNNIKKINLISFTMNDVNARKKEKINIIKQIMDCDDNCPYPHY